MSQFVKAVTAQHRSVKKHQGQNEGQKSLHLVETNTDPDPATEPDWQDLDADPIGSGSTTLIMPTLNY